MTRMAGPAVRAIACGLMVVVLFTLSANVLVAAAPSQVASGPESLSSTDRDLLITVREANLWEIPMSQEAAKRGQSPRVRQVGAILAQDHIRLNVIIEQLASQFEVTLPDEPTSPQQQWMAEISSKSGVDFDKTYVNRLRAAHGTIFGLIAEVRAGTTNDAMRAFAQQANDIVMKHMTLLESTGYVLPSSTYQSASARTPDNAENQLSETDYVLAVAFGLLVLAATLVLVRLLSSRGKTGR